VDDDDIIQLELGKIMEFLDEGQSIIPLKMEETAIEKLSEGTITIAPETTLGIPEEENLLDKLGIELPPENGEKGELTT
jgi:hypothetical protein